MDAVIFVFSLENEASFNAIYNYYTKLSHYRNTTEKDIPIILVGTQGNWKSGRMHFITSSELKDETRASTSMCNFSLGSLESLKWKVECREVEVVVRTKL